MGHGKGKCRPEHIDVHHVPALERFADQVLLHVLVKARGIPDGLLGGQYYFFGFLHFRYLDVYLVAQAYAGVLAEDAVHSYNIQAFVVRVRLPDDGQRAFLSGHLPRLSVNRLP